MKLKIKLAPGASVAFTSSGQRLVADDEGCVQVEEFTQSHYDLIAAGGEVVTPTAAVDEADDGPADSEGGEPA